MSDKSDQSIYLFRWKCFQKDWPKFQQTDEYKRLHGTLLKFGMKDPYADNLLHRTFYSGYFNEPFIKDEPKRTIKT